MNQQHRSATTWAAAAIAAASALALAGQPPALARIPAPSAAPQQQPASQQPDPALRDYLSANGLLNRGLFELAVEEYRKFLAAHPNHDKAPTARYGLGVSLFRMKNYEEAARELQPLLQARDFPFAAETLLIVGQSNFELKKWEQAIAPLQRLVGEHARHDAADDAAALLVESLYRTDRHQDIEQPWSQFETNWAQSPQRERADYLRGLALLARGEDAAAAKHFGEMQRRAADLPDGGQFSDRVALLRAQCLHREGDLVRAAQGYKSVIEGSAGEGDLAADATFGLAMLSQQAGDAGAAAQHYDTFLKDFSGHASAPIAMLERGRLLIDEKRIDRARQLLEAAWEADETRRDRAAYWLAKCDLREDQFADAAARLDTAIKQWPESELAAEMLYDRGVALARAQQPAEAVAALNEFRERFGGHALAADATHLQAMLEHERQRYDASAELCETFTKRYPEHARAGDIAFVAAENELLRDRLPEAVQLYESFLGEYREHAQAQAARFRMAGALFRLQRYDDARGHLESVAKGRETDKAYRRALMMLGDIAFQQQRWNDAVSLLDDYLSFGVDQPLADDAKLKLALACERLDRHDDALQHLSELPNTFPDSPHKLQATFERGQILLARDRLDEARPLLEEVIAAGADKPSRFHVHAINHLATIAMRQEQWDRAAELYAQVAAPGEESDQAGGELRAGAMFNRAQALMAARKYAEAAEAFAKVSEEFPRHERAAEARAQRAIALARSGSDVDALAAIEQVQQRDASGLRGDLHAALLYEKAWCLRELARDEEAMQAYRDLLREHAADANAPHAMLELAELEAAAGRHEQAAELLASLRETARDEQRRVADDVKERGLYRLAVSQFELGRHDDAAKNAEAFIAEFPHSGLRPSARLFAGEALFRLERWQPASEHFADIVQNHAQDSGCATAMLRLGETQAHLDRWVESEKTFTDYLERFASSELWFQAQFGLGWARENRGLHDEAMEAYRRVIERHSGVTAARAQFQIGQCLFAQEKHADAVRELLKVDILYGYPEWSAAALFEAGRCFEQMNQTEQARAQFEQVRQKYPETEWAKLAAERLAVANDGAGGSSPGRAGG